MIQTSFLIPLKDQFTQDLHPHTKFEEIEKDLFLMFDGWTFTGIQSEEYIFRDSRQGRIFIGGVDIK